MSITVAATPSGGPVIPPAAKPWYAQLYLQVLVAIVLGRAARPFLRRRPARR